MLLATDRPACKCHAVFPEYSKINDLVSVSQPLNNACRDAQVQTVKEILEQQKSTGRLGYLLQGVRTDIHGNLLTNSMEVGMAMNITPSPFYIVTHNLTYNAKDQLTIDKYQAIYQLLVKSLDLKQADNLTEGKTTA